MTLCVRRATVEDVEALAPMFDNYRVFYQQASDLDLARAFLRQRLQRGESVVLLVLDGADALGFTQLYPAYSSVYAQRTWILNDLFVAPDARRRGAARALLDAAAVFAREDGALRLELETDRDNHDAQALYRNLGWTEYDETLRFRLPLQV